MAQVTVQIDGKAYRMACEEGQEDHLTDLATRFAALLFGERDHFVKGRDLIKPIVRVITGRQALTRAK